MNGFRTIIPKRERRGFILRVRGWTLMSVTANASCAANGSTMASGSQ